MDNVIQPQHDDYLQVEDERTLRIIADRELQATNDTIDEVTEAPIAAPTADNMPSTDDVSILSDKDGAMRFGIILLAAAVVIFAFLGWRSLKYWRLRRQRYMLQVQSSRADAVLGDMQMVPNDDEDDEYEDDPELL